MLKSVKLYGELAERYGKDWHLDINSPSEAVRALAVNNPGFRQFVSSSQDRGVGYKISVGKTFIQSLEEIYYPSGRQEIKIIPVVLGAKKDGGLAIILGIALMVAAPHLALAAEGAIGAGLGGAGMVASPLAIHAGTSTAAMMVQGAAMNIGFNLVLAGVGAALTNTPEPVKDDENYSFDGAANTVRQGVPVPVCYGQLLVGGAVISSGITNENYSP